MKPLDEQRAETRPRRREEEPEEPEVDLDEPLRVVDPVADELRPMRGRARHGPAYEVAVTRSVVRRAESTLRASSGQS